MLSSSGRATDAKLEAVMIGSSTARTMRKVYLCFATSQSTRHVTLSGAGLRTTCRADGGQHHSERVSAKRFLRSTYEPLMTL